MNGAAVSDPDREPSVTEIAVALREARRGASRLLAFPPAADRAPAASPLGVVPAAPEIAAPALEAAPDLTDAAALRTAEYRRLVAENARLNERIGLLLDRLAEMQSRPERRPEPAPAPDAAAEAEARAADQAAIAALVQDALQSELRPVLGALLQMLEKQRRGTPSGAPPGTRDDRTIVDLDAPDC